MKFEEALKLLREGKKIRYSLMPADEYFIGCYFQVIGLSIEESTKYGMSIVKMKGDKQAPVMFGKLTYINKIKTQLKTILTDEEYKKYHNLFTEIEIGNIFDADIFLYPQLNLLSIMRDDWETVE